MLLALYARSAEQHAQLDADVEHRLGVPVLGVLHKVKGFEKRRICVAARIFQRHASTFAEAVRTVRTSIMMSASTSSESRGGDVVRA
jgi:hypothetical protein